jgi:peptidoglycan/LPS O-acetylase OafA/YrhL
MTTYKAQIKPRDVLKSLWSRGGKDDPLIDGLRGSCIILIVIFHSFYGVLFLLRKPEPILEFIGRVPLWLSFVCSADKAVDIFFLVSAYLLGGSLFNDREHGRPIGLKEFYAKRLARIYPLFFLGLLLYSPVSPTRALRNLPYNLLFIDNFDNRSIIPVGWSLSIEMQFYLVLPWLAIGLYRLSHSWRLVSLWSLFALSFVTQALVALAHPIIYETRFYDFHPDRVDPTLMMDSLYYPTHTRFGPLVLGLLWAYLKVHRQPSASGAVHLSSDQSPNQGRQGLLVIATVLGLLLMWASTFFPVYNPNTLYYRHFSPWLNLVLHVSHRNLYVLGLWAVMVGLTVYGGQSHLHRMIRGFLSWSIWRPFAQTVFPIYLFHFPMIALAGLTVFQTTQIKTLGPIEVWHVFAIAGIASIYSLILGTLLHIYIEVPCMRLGYGWARRRFGAKTKASLGSFR